MSTDTTSLRKFIAAAHEAGYAIAVAFEGEPILEESSDQTAEEVVEAAQSIEICHLLVCDMSAPAGSLERVIGWALIVWDVGEGEEIADYNLKIEHLIPDTD